MQRPRISQADHIVRLVSYDTPHARKGKPHELTLNARGKCTHGSDGPGHYHCDTCAATGFAIDVQFAIQVIDRLGKHTESDTSPRDFRRIAACAKSGCKNEWYSTLQVDFFRFLGHHHAFAQRCLCDTMDVDAAAIIEDVLAHWGPETAVAVFADHGEEFGEHGSAYHGITAYQELKRGNLDVIRFLCQLNDMLIFFRQGLKVCGQFGHKGDLLIRTLKHHAEATSLPGDVIELFNSIPRL